MPKRTNTFQQAVTYIVEQLAPLGAVVRESVLLREGGMTDVSREVDTLIECAVGPSLVRLAVESRDRARKDDIEWIDCLIGKYTALPVDGVVAISNSGFSATAKAKASLNKIFILSPKEVMTADWPTRFQKIGIAAISVEFKVASIEFQTDPPFAGSL